MLKKSVLIVDTDADWSGKLYEAMKGSGLYVVEPPKTDGRAALESIQSRRPNIIVMDVMMSSFDGRYIVSFIRDYMAGYEPLIYLMSAIPAEHLVMQWNDMSRVYFARKPQTISCAMSNIKYLAYENGSEYRAPVSVIIHERNAQTKREPDLESKVVDFILRIDSGMHYKGFVAARTVIKLLLADQNGFRSATQLYNKAAEELGTTRLQTERNLRSFRDRAHRKSTAFYRENLAIYNESNSVFFWNACRILKEELDGEKL